MLEAEDHHSQADPDLRSGEPRTARGDHRFAHVRDERLQFRRRVTLDRLGAFQQPRIAHLENFAFHHWLLERVVKARGSPAAAATASLL